MRRRPLGAKRSYGFALVAAGAAIWGGDALFRRGLALELPASVVVFVEHLILVVLTGPIAYRAVRRRPTFKPGDVVALVLVGAGSSALATVLFTYAFTLGSPTTPLLLQKLQPVFAVLGAHLLLRERLMPKYAAFFVISLVGAYLITFADPAAVSLDSSMAGALSLGAAALWAMGTVLGRHLSELLTFRELTSLRFAVGLPASALILFVDGEAPTIATLDGSDLVGLLLLALIPGLVALVIYYRGLRETPASAATVAELAFPLSAIVINRFVFGDSLSTTQWVGVALLSLTILVMTGLASRGTRFVGVLGPREATT
jgi:DME family drug/metabolite transporter